MNMTTAAYSAEILEIEESVVISLTIRLLLLSAPQKTLRDPF